MTPEQELLAALSAMILPPPPKPPQFRVYYRDDGSIITYTMEDLPGQWISVTADQYAQSRMDAIVKDNKLIYTHRRSHIGKLVKNTQGVKCSKYDINILTDTDYWCWTKQYSELDNNE